MKFFSRLTTIFLAVALVVCFTGCPSDDNGKKDDGKDNELQVSFDNFESPSVVITNNTYERLVAFKGTVSAATLVSGIPSMAQNHGLKKDEALFNVTQDFVLVLVTEAQFNAHKDDLSVLNNQLFTRLYAIYDHSGTTIFDLTVDTMLGGTGRLTVNNPTDYSFELRRDSPYGSGILYYVPQQTAGNVISLEAPAVYNIVPVIRFYNQVDHELSIVVPRNTDDMVFIRNFVFTDEQLNYTLNLAEVMEWWDGE